MSRILVRMIMVVTMLLVPTVVVAPAGGPLAPSGPRTVLVAVYAARAQADAAAAEATP